MEAIVYYLVLGAGAGVAAGLLGIGGGLVIVPVLVMILSRQGVPVDVVTHVAIGTSLATIVATGASATWAHHRREAVLWPIVLRLSAGLVAGAWLGAFIADGLPGRALSGVFGVFEILVAMHLFLNGRPHPARQLPGTMGTTGAGLVIGAISTLLGIGGGSLTVPFLTWCGIGIRQAVASASACGLPIAIAGSVGFILTGWGTPDLPANSTGYVHWPAAAGIVVASMAFAPLGARLAHTLPTTVLRRIFALVLALLGIRMLWG